MGLFLLRRPERIAEIPHGLDVIWFRLLGAWLHLALVGAAVSSAGAIFGWTSLADLLLAPIVYYLMAFPDLQEKLAPLGNLQRWYGELSARPAFKKTEPPRPD